MKHKIMSAKYKAPHGWEPHECVVDCQFMVETPASEAKRQNQWGFKPFEALLEICAILLINPHALVGR